MKNILFALLCFVAFFMAFFPASLTAQIADVTVETYYISDATDSASSVDYGDTLAVGSTTYRVFIHLMSGYKLKKIFGDANHTLKIASTSNFYNNVDRPNSYFGYMVNKSWFPGNPALFLDSWLTIGRATQTHGGVLKAEDPDGSITGGYSMLKNCDPAAGICLKDSDGLMPVAAYSGSWSYDGFVDINGYDSTVFGSVNSGNEFVSNNAYLLQNGGVSGPLPDNKVLVAQLTTKGTISFELNAEVLDSTGKSTFFIARGVGSSNSDTLISPFLKYPAECGCRDPQYLEYSPSYACDVSDSCKTHIIFGCMDTMACNYDPKANFHVVSLCCYPGYCNDRDLAVVCPSVTAANGDIIIYPNPAQDYITVKQTGQLSEMPFRIAIFNSFGNRVLEQSSADKINISFLNPGLYMAQLIKDGTVYESKTFMKD